jgi:adenosylhomocysteinase
MASWSKKIFFLLFDFSLKVCCLLMATTAASLRLLNAGRDVPADLDSEQKVFDWLWTYWNKDRGPLTYVATEKWERSKVLNLRVLHCLPTFLTTLLKLKHLRAMVGSNIVCCESKFVGSDPVASRLLREKTSFKLVTMDEAIELGKREPFDVVLDCGGELAGKVVPRIGVVELTQTGEQKYARLAAVESLPYRVISVDSSRLKRIEDRLGSADGFLRALILLTDLEKQKGGTVVIFGFGKVGVGCAEQLGLRSFTCLIVDVADASLERARKMGLEALHFDKDRVAIEAALKSAWCVVTCTGVAGVMSSFSTKDVGASTYLCNMGEYEREQSELLFA